MQIYYLIYILEWIFQGLTIETEVILSHLKDSIRLIDIFYQIYCKIITPIFNYFLTKSLAVFLSHSFSLLKLFIPIKYKHYQIIMRNLLRGSGSLIKYNYLKNHKKPITEIPTTIPPKYIHYVVYHPTSMPDFDMKFRDHKHFDPWTSIYYGEQDKYEFQYSGQWWNAIGISGRITIFVSTVLFLVYMNDSAEERKRKHLPGLLSYYEVGEAAVNHLPTYLQN